MATKGTQRRDTVGVTYEDVRAAARASPGVEGRSYGTPALKVGGELFLASKRTGSPWSCGWIGWSGNSSCGARRTRTS
jgi:hypothetical protein